MRFDGERWAAFVTSFNASDVASSRIVGTKGVAEVDLIADRDFVLFAGNRQPPVFPIAVDEDVESRIESALRHTRFLAREFKDFCEGPGPDDSNIHDLFADATNPQLLLHPNGADILRRGLEQDAPQIEALHEDPAGLRVGAFRNSPATKLRLRDVGMKDSEISLGQRVEIVESDELTVMKDRQGVQLRVDPCFIRADPLPEGVGKLILGRKLCGVGSEGLNEPRRGVKPVVENEGDVRFGEIADEDRSGINS